MPTQECLPVKSCKAVKCCCGKVCKEDRGLKLQQRSYRVIDDLEDELQQQMTEALNEHHNEDNADPVKPELSSVNTQENFPGIKKGITVPKSLLQWSTANDFFKLALLNYPVISHDLNNNIFRTPWQRSSTITSARTLDMYIIITTSNLRKNT